MLTQSDHRDLRPMINPPVFPSTPSEFITIVAHYHRAEIARMAGWRDRIDRTTNWAITVVAAMLSLSLSTPTAHHGVLLFAMVLVLLLLVIEARRYRFFDVYRNRVRRLERNYFAQIFAPETGTTARGRFGGSEGKLPFLRLNCGPISSYAANDECGELKPVNSAFDEVMSE